ncbi:MAG: DUF308 domain-containing protein [Prolixibacteraceae bacterium]|nr:DUF308 domain-containing protein [Prolixibacteraceae bacterium]
MKNRIKYSIISLNGVLAIIFGLVALFFPGLTLGVLGVYFAISIIIGCVTLIVGFFKAKPASGFRYSLLIEGVIGILIGLIILARPSVVATVFVAIIGIWAIIIGLVLLYDYVRLRLPVMYNTFVLLISIVSLVMGIVIIINPFRSARLLIVIIGIYAIIYGVYSLANSLRYRLI